MARLELLVHNVKEVTTPIELLKQVEAHLAEAKSLAQAKPTINVRLCDAIVCVFRSVCASWDSVPHHARPWLCAAMLYFIENPDEEHDFNSLVGFDDDAEVLNACLALAGLDTLKIFIEEYV